MKDPLLVDSLVIGRGENRIEKHVDGSIIFRDTMVPGIRLIDLLGGNVVIDPALYVVIEKTDWLVDGNLFMVNIPHNWNLCYPTLVDVNIYNEQYELIDVDTVKVMANSVIIKLILPSKILVSIKKM
jgi:hypothetical protein